MNNQHRIEEFIKLLKTQPDLKTNPAFTDGLDVLTNVAKTPGRFIVVPEETNKVDLVFNDASVKEFNLVINKIKSEKVITPHSLLKFLDSKGLRLIKK